MNITIKDLNKKYKGGKHALKNLNLEINSGMFGLLGPNGAGKSSLMRIMVTLMEASSGQILIDGLDLNKNRKHIRRILGYLPQDFRFFSKFTTWEFLEFSAKLAGFRNNKDCKNAVEEMLEKVTLYEVRNRSANKLSGGMKRRLGIAQALIGNPKLLVVDEPTTGLDPEERIKFRNLLSDISSNDMIIILSTHIVGDISSSCNDMALLTEGELAFKGSPSELIEKTKGSVWQIEASHQEYDILKEKYPIISTIPTANGVEIQLIANNIDGYKGIPIEPNLEHAYVHFIESRLN